MDSLIVGGVLRVNDELLSDNGNARLVLQGDGNLVGYRTDNQSPLWASGTVGRGGTTVVLQGDGNLVLYRADGHPVWATNTVGRGTSVLRMQNDGNVVAYAGGVAVWASNSAPSWPDLGVRDHYDYSRLPRDPADPNRTRLAGDVLTIFAAAATAVRPTNDTPVVVTFGSAPGVTWWKGVQIRNWRDEVVGHLTTQDARHFVVSGPYTMSQLSGGRLILEAAKALGTHRPMYEIRLPDPLRSVPLVTAGADPDVTLRITWDSD